MLDLNFEIGFCIGFGTVWTRKRVQTLSKSHLGYPRNRFQIWYEQVFWSKLPKTLSKTISQKKTVEYPPCPFWRHFEPRNEVYTDGEPGPPALAEAVGSAGPSSSPTHTAFRGPPRSLARTHFGDLWMWLHLMCCNLKLSEVRLGSFGVAGPQSNTNDPERTSDNLKLQPHGL